MNDPQSEQKLHQVQVLVPHENDVLLGRGALINNHPGNDWYRRLVNSNKELYRQCQKHDKLIVAKNIVQMVHLRTPPGRFLEQSTGLWMPVSNEKAVRKTSQALREKRASKGRGAAYVDVASQQITSAHPAQGFRPLMPIEAQSARGVYSSAPLMTDASAIVPQSPQPASSSVWRTHITRTDPILSPIEPHTTLHFTTSSNAMEEKKAPPESDAAYTTLLLNNDQFPLNRREDTSQKSLFAQGIIDGSVEATQLLLPDDALFQHALAMEHVAFTNQHATHFSQSDVDTSDLQSHSEKKTFSSHLRESNSIAPKRR